MFTERNFQNSREEDHFDHLVETGKTPFEADEIIRDERYAEQSPERARQLLAAGALEKTAESTASRPKKRAYRGGDTPNEPRDPHYPLDTTGQLAPDQQAGWRMVRDAGKKPQ